MLGVLLASSMACPVPPEVNEVPAVGVFMSALRSHFRAVAQLMNLQLVIVGVVVSTVIAYVAEMGVVVPDTREIVRRYLAGAIDHVAISVGITF